MKSIMHVEFYVLQQSYIGSCRYCIKTGITDDLFQAVQNQFFLWETVTTFIEHTYTSQF